MSCFSSRNKIENNQQMDGKTERRKINAAVLNGHDETAISVDINHTGDLKRETLLNDYGKQRPYLSISSFYLFILNSFLSKCSYHFFLLASPKTYVFSLFTTKKKNVSLICSLEPQYTGNI